MRTSLRNTSSPGSRGLQRRAAGYATGLALGLLLASQALADVAVMPVQGTNAKPREAEAVGVLLADAYATKSGERTLDPSVTGPALKEKGDASSAAASLNANEYIAVRIVKLERLYTISATRYTVGGAVVHTAKITASSLDDMVPAADRLAQALHDRTDIKDAMTLDNITEREVATPNRVKTETIAGVKTAMTFAVAKDMQFAPMLTLTYDGRHESRDFFVEWGIGFTVPSNTKDDDEEQYGGLHAEFGLSYYLTRSITSPYLGGGVLPRIMSGGVSLAPYLQGGLMFMRNSSTRVYTDLRVAQNVLPQDFGYEYSEDGLGEARKDKYPTEFTLSFGVGF